MENTAITPIGRIQDENKYRAISFGFLKVTTPAYLIFFIVVTAIKLIGLDAIDENHLVISALHIFGVQLVLYLLLRCRSNVSRQYMINMLWFMVYNNILFCGYWVLLLDQSRTLVYVLAPMSVVTLFTISKFFPAVIYNIILWSTLSVCAYFSVINHGYALKDVYLDWVLIFSCFVVGVWLSLISGVYTKNRKELAGLIRYADDSNSKLELALKDLSIAHEKLEMLSITDPLTQVYNRRFFDTCIQKAWNSALITRNPLSVVLVDADHFKAVNDNHGHVVGDLCLKQIAGDIRRCLKRQDDIVCRYGGEEFAVILPNTGRDSALVVANRIRDCIAAHPLSTETLNVPLSVSAGLATMTESQSVDDAVALFSLADIALLEAKRYGRNCVVHNDSLINEN